MYSVSLALRGSKTRFTYSWSRKKRSLPFRNLATLPKLPIFEALARHEPQRIAVVHSYSGRRFTYGQLLQDVGAAKDRLREFAPQHEMTGRTIAFLMENGFDYVVTLLSVLGNRSIALPLSPAFPAKELRYILNDSQALMLLSSQRFEEKAKEIIEDGVSRRPALIALEKGTERSGPSVTGEAPKFLEPDEDSGGLMLYTSGSTGRPKGVLLSQSVLTAQSRSLLEAWRYGPNDHLLHVLPLHHIHGIVNALLTPLFAGSAIEFMYPFNADAVWERLGTPFLTATELASKSQDKITLFTAVPTIYNRLLSSHTDLPSDLHDTTREAISPHNLRLNISGSAALPTPTKAAWTELSRGNTLLERYGMTEVGMALSCGLDMADRVDGSVGWPLPSVEVRLVDTESNETILPGDELDKNGNEREGEIQLRGPTVFNGYWRNPTATATEFVDAEDGDSNQRKWFKTGDVAIREPVEGAGKSDQEWARGPMYFIRGRKSVDIIKTGGEKVSALEVERELLSLPQIAEAAVLGLPSTQWGQKVAAIVVLHPDVANTGRGGKRWGAMDMRRALRDRLAPYKIPQELKVVQEALPRNAMGKSEFSSSLGSLF
ncbi:MAG: hypothetical protein M1817_000042 [Caeruleum heppii]|nr:MAG: hypothetical protein M1817_000042 [Caeruleum heppii]